jgi:hypothetical protein
MLNDGPTAGTQLTHRNPQVHRLRINTVQVRSYAVTGRRFDCLFYIPNL